jgi:hypothetical protein
MISEYSHLACRRQAVSEAETETEAETYSIFGSKAVMSFPDS